jgi:hypothetical protein
MIEKCRNHRNRQQAQLSLWVGTDLCVHTFAFLLALLFKRDQYMVGRLQKLTGQKESFFFLVVSAGDGTCSATTPIPTPALSWI